MTSERFYPFRCHFYLCFFCIFAFYFFYTDQWTRSCCFTVSLNSYCFHNFVVTIFPYRNNYFITNIDILAVIQIVVEMSALSKFNANKNGSISIPSPVVLFTFSWIEIKVTPSDGSRYHLRYIYSVYERRIVQSLMGCL